MSVGVCLCLCSRVSSISTDCRHMQAWLFWLSQNVKSFETVKPPTGLRLEKKIVGTLGSRERGRCYKILSVYDDNIYTWVISRTSVPVFTCLISMCIYSDGESACVYHPYVCVCECERVISKWLPLSQCSPFIFPSPREIPRAPFPRLCGDCNILCRRLPHRMHGGHRGGVPHEEHCKETWLWGATSSPQTEQADPSAPPGNRK